MSCCPSGVPAAVGLDVREIKASVIQFPLARTDRIVQSRWFNQLSQLSRPDHTELASSGFARKLTLPRTGTDTSRDGRRGG